MPWCDSCFFYSQSIGSSTTRESTAMKLKLRKCSLRLDRRGFTLVELMIAVAIIAILAGFLAPSVMTFVRRTKGKTAARDVANTLRLAHNQAKSRGEVILAHIAVDGGNDYSGDAVTGGKIELFRTQNDSIAECDPTHADFDPANTDCFAMSCAQAQAMTDTEDEPVHTLDLSQTSPDMMILKMDPAATERMICFSPTGRVLDMTGLAFESEDTYDCEATNLRLFVRSKETGADATNPLSGGPALDKCIEAVGAGGTVDAGKKTSRQLQKDGRDLENFYSIHVPYNGAISVNQ